MHVCMGSQNETQCYDLTWFPHMYQYTFRMLCNIIENHVMLSFHIINHSTRADYTNYIQVVYTSQGISSYIHTHLLINLMNICILLSNISG